MAKKLNVYEKLSRNLAVFFDKHYNENIDFLRCVNECRSYLVNNFEIEDCTEPKKSVSVPYQIKHKPYSEVIESVLWLEFSSKFVNESDKADIETNNELYKKNEKYATVKSKVDEIFTDPNKEVLANKIYDFIIELVTEDEEN